MSASEFFDWATHLVRFDSCCTDIIHKGGAVHGDRFFVPKATTFDLYLHALRGHPSAFSVDATAMYYKTFTAALEKRVAELPPGPKLIDFQQIRDKDKRVRGLLLPLGLVSALPAPPAAAGSKSPETTRTPPPPQTPDDAPRRGAPRTPLAAEQQPPDRVEPRPVARLSRCPKDPCYNRDCELDHGPGYRYCSGCKRVQPPDAFDALYKTCTASRARSRAAHRERRKRKKQLEDGDGDDDDDPTTEDAAAPAKTRFCAADVADLREELAELSRRLDKRVDEAIEQLMEDQDSRPVLGMDEMRKGLAELRKRVDDHDAQLAEVVTSEIVREAAQTRHQERPGPHQAAGRQRHAAQGARRQARQAHREALNECLRVIAAGFRGGTARARPRTSRRACRQS